MSDMAFNAVLNEVDSFSYNQCVQLLARLSKVLQNWNIKEEAVDSDKKHRLEVLAGLQKFRGRLSEDFDADRELAEARKQKYSESTVKAITAAEFLKLGNWTD